MASALPESERHKLDAVFNTYDVNSDGSLSAAELRAIQASCSLPLNTMPATSPQPLWPVDQLVSSGQRKETAEVESRASAATCDRISEKQVQKPRRGSQSQTVVALEARNPKARANKRLWVGPRWKALPFQ